MGKLVKVEIPLTEEAAATLSDPVRIEDAGRLLSSMLAPKRPDIEGLRSLITEIKSDARAGGLTDQDIDDELAAYKAERRL